MGLASASSSTTTTSRTNGTHPSGNSRPARIASTAQSWITDHHYLYGRQRGLAIETVSIIDYRLCASFSQDHSGGPTNDETFLACLGNTDRVSGLDADGWRESPCTSRKRYAHLHDRRRAGRRLP